jgi:hypothetical protein
VSERIALEFFLPQYYYFQPFDKCLNRSLCNFVTCVCEARLLWWPADSSSGRVTCSCPRSDSLTILSFLFLFSQQLYFSESKCKDKKFLSCTQVHIVTSGSCVTGSDEWHSKVDPQRELPLSMPDASRTQWERCFPFTNIWFFEAEDFVFGISVFGLLPCNEKIIMCFWLLEHCSIVLLIMKLQAGWLVKVSLARMLVLLSHCCRPTRCFQGIRAPNPTLYVGLSLP